MHRAISAINSKTSRARNKSEEGTDSPNALLRTRDAIKQDSQVLVVVRDSLRDSP